MVVMSLMDGCSRLCGSVAGVRIVKNPIRAARLVMETTPHHFLLGEGAELLAKRHGLTIVPNSHFDVDTRWRHLNTIRHSANLPPLGPQRVQTSSLPAEPLASQNNNEHGTVGCVCLDMDGHLAAGTSTGGVSGKMSGRVGDSPIIGAGTYAEDGLAAVSCTGNGEFFIRSCLAKDIVSSLRYSSPQQTHDFIQTIPPQNLFHPITSNRELIPTPFNSPVTRLQQTLVRSFHSSFLSLGLGAEGGLIAVDAQGEVACLHNSEAMFRAYVSQDSIQHIAINQLEEIISGTHQLASQDSRYSS